MSNCGPILEGDRRAKMIELHGQDYVCKHYPRGCPMFEPCAKQKHNREVRNVWPVSDLIPHLYTDMNWDWCFYGRGGLQYGPFDNRCIAVEEFNKHMEGK